MVMDASNMQNIFLVEWKEVNPKLFEKQQGLKYSQDPQN